jgi:ABC-2 type transport system permease protein
MLRTLQIAAQDLRVFFSQWSNWAVLTLMPIALTVILGLAIQGGYSTVVYWVDIIDQDGSPAARTLVDELAAQNDAFVLCTEGTEIERCQVNGEAAPTLEESLARLEAGTVDNVLVIPAGYEQALADYTPVTLGVTSRADLTAQSSPFSLALGTVLQRINGASVAAQVGGGFIDAYEEERDQPVLTEQNTHESFVSDVYRRAAEQWESVPVAVVTTTGGASEPAAAAGPAGFTQSVPGMATMFVLFTVLDAMAILLRERQQWTLQRVAVMPVRRWQILGGKISSRFVLGMVQALIVFAVGIAMGLDLGNDPLLLVLVMAAYVLCITALALALGNFIRSEQQASSLTLLLALVFSALGGAWWSLDLPFVPEIMRTLGHLTPTAWAMDAFNQLLFFGGGLAEILLPIGVLLAAAAVLFAIGIANFRYD